MNKKGFTLIELLIVISIIGILAVALLPNILSAPATARDAGRKAAMNDVIAAMEQYKANTGAYPLNGGTITSAIAGVKLSSLSMNSYFKGNNIPVGASVPTGSETVLDVAEAAGANDVIYCPLKTNTKGYSYAVAIRMEQPQGGATAYNTAKACSTTADGSDLGNGSSTNWYVMVQ